MVSTRVPCKCHSLPCFWHCPLTSITTHTSALTLWERVCLSPVVSTLSIYFFPLLFFFFFLYPSDHHKILGTLTYWGTQRPYRMASQFCPGGGDTNNSSKRWFSQEHAVIWERTHGLSPVFPPHDACSCVAEEHLKVSISHYRVDK